MKMTTQTDGRIMFVGSFIPMELARKTWPDKYAATTAANKAGFAVYANGEYVADPAPVFKTYPVGFIVRIGQPGCLPDCYEHVPTGKRGRITLQ